MQHSILTIDKTDYDDVKSILLNSQEKEKGEEMIKLLKPFFDAGNYSLKSKSVTVSSILYVIQTVMNCLNKKKGTGKFFNEQADIAEKNLYKRGKSFPEEVLICAILDPRHKKLEFLNEDIFYDKKEIYKLLENIRSITR